MVYDILYSIIVGNFSSKFVKQISVLGLWLLFIINYAADANNYQ